MGLKRTIRSSCFSIKNYHQDQIILSTTHWYSSDFELGSLKSLRSNCFKLDKSLSSSKGLLWLSVSYLKGLVKNWGERGQRKTRMTSPPGIFPQFRSTFKKSFFWEKKTVQERFPFSCEKKRGGEFEQQQEISTDEGDFLITWQIFFSAKKFLIGNNSTFFWVFW